MSCQYQSKFFLTYYNSYKNEEYTRLINLRLQPNCFRAVCCCCFVVVVFALLLFLFPIHCFMFVVCDCWYWGAECCWCLELYFYPVLLCCFLLLFTCCSRCLFFHHCCYKLLFSTTMLLLLSTPFSCFCCWFGTSFWRCLL